MLQRSGTGGKADYGKGGRNRAVEEGESVRMGAESEWDKGEGGGRNRKKSLYVENQKI